VNEQLPPLACTVGPPCSAHVYGPLAPAISESTKEPVGALHDDEVTREDAAKAMHSGAQLLLSVGTRTEPSETEQPA